MPKSADEETKPSSADIENAIVLKKQIDALAEEKPSENRVIVKIKDPDMKENSRSKSKRNKKRRSSIEML